MATTQLSASTVYTGSAGHLIPAYPYAASDLGALGLIKDERTHI